MLIRIQCDISFRHLDFSLILKACLLEGMGETGKIFESMQVTSTFLVDLIQLSVPVPVAHVSSVIQSDILLQILNYEKGMWIEKLLLILKEVLSYVS